MWIEFLKEYIISILYHLCMANVMADEEIIRLGYLVLIQPDNAPRRILASVEARSTLFEYI